MYIMGISAGYYKICYGRNEYINCYSAKIFIFVFDRIYFDESYG